jgi:hypothetical protein
MIDLLKCQILVIKPASGILCKKLQTLPQKHTESLKAQAHPKKFENS